MISKWNLGLDIFFSRFLSSSCTLRISPSDRPEQKFRFRIPLSILMALKYGVAVGVAAAAVAAGVGSKHACARDRWTVNDSEFLSVSFKTLSAARRERERGRRERSPRERWS